MDAQRKHLTHLKKGNKYFAEEKYDLAIEEYKKGVEIKPDFYEAYFNWGNALFEQIKFEEAEKKFEKAAELKPDDYEAYFNWGNALYYQGKFEEAAEKFKKVVELKNDFYKAYGNWGIALDDQGKFEEAAEKYKKVLELKLDDYRAYGNWGVTLAKQGKFEEAEEKFKKVIELKTDDQKPYLTYLNWGIILAKQGKFEEAAEKFEKAADLKNDDYNAYANWGSSLYEQRKFDESAEKYRKASELKPDAYETYINWGIALAKQGKFEEAAEKFKKAAELKPDDQIIYFNWGNTLDDQGKYEEAEEKIKKALELKPDYQEAYLVWGIVLYEQKKYLEAAEKFKNASELKPDDQEAYFYWGNTLLKRHLYDETEKKYQKTLELNPDYDAAIYNLGYLSWIKGECKEALEEWKKAKTKYKEKIEKYGDKTKASVFLGLGRILAFFLDDQEEAEKIFKKGLETYPDDIELLSCLIKLYLSKKEDKGDNTRYWIARGLFEKLKINLKSKGILEKNSLLLGHLYFYFEMFDSARKEFIEIIKKEGDNQESLSYLGLIYLKEGNYKKSIKYLELSLAINPDDFQIRCNLAEACHRSGLLEKAEKEYNTIINCIPRHFEAKIGLGEVYCAMGDNGEEEMYEKSRKLFEESLEIAESDNRSRRLSEKEQAAVYYSLGYIKVKLYEMSRDFSILKQAKKAFETCREKDSDHSKAIKAMEAIKKFKSSYYTLRTMEKLGPLFIFILAFAILIPVQIKFFLGGHILEWHIFGHNFSIYIGYIDIGYYSLLTLALLVVMIAMLAFPNLLRLKLPGIELEKSSMDLASVPVSLGITREPVFELAELPSFNMLAEN
jgi:tetratricopeptide (TPR) repeat protein